MRAVLNPTERMDMLWMGKQLPPTPKFLRDADRGDSKLTHAGPSSPSVHAATPTGTLQHPDCPMASMDPATDHCGVKRCAFSASTEVIYHM